MGVKLDAYIPQPNTKGHEVQIVAESLEEHDAWLRERVGPRRTISLVRGKHRAFLRETKGAWGRVFGTFESTGLRTATYLINDPDVAMLFKLTFGGQ